jgi:hypothetical protein
MVLCSSVVLVGDVPGEIPQEEGEYEYASYHSDAKGGQEEAHVESAVLEGKGTTFGPGLEVQGEGEARVTPGSALAHMCIEEHNKGACIRYASFSGNLIHGAENLAKRAAKAVVKAARGIVHWLKSHAAEVDTVACLVQGIGAGTLVGAGATALSDGIGVYQAGVIGGPAGAAVTYACEHEKF